jgi:transcriptional regulator with XRE-family HTH domain
MIKQLRERKGWSQSELARRAGISQGVLSDIESGRTKNPRSDTLAAIARALKVPIEKLLRKAA